MNSYFGIGVKILSKQNLILLTLLLLGGQTFSQHNIARKWMDTGLLAVKREGQGPTVHARNMFHAMIAVYDAWAVYNEKAKPYLLGNDLNGFACEFDENVALRRDSLNAMIDTAINYAVYRVLHYRFNLYSSKGRTIDGIDSMFEATGMNPRFRSTDYSTGNPAALGNYIAECVINYGDMDGSKELNNYEADQYFPMNPALRPDLPGTEIVYPNRWQPLALRDYIEKKGLDPTIPDWVYILVDREDIFLTPEWGEVLHLRWRRMTKRQFTGEAATIPFILILAILR